MQHELKQKLKSVTKDRVMDLLINTNPMDVPKAMVSQEAERMKQQMIQDMQQRGQSSSMDLPASMFEDQARRRVHLGLLVSEIMKEQQFTPDADKVRETIAEFAESYENPQEVIDYYMQDQNARSSVENVVLEGEVVDWVLGQVQLTDENKTFAEVMDNTA
jgi:trigger factor